MGGSWGGVQVSAIAKPLMRIISAPIDWAATGRSWADWAGGSYAPVTGDGNAVTRPTTDAQPKGHPGAWPPGVALGVDVDRGGVA